jgi:trigger factor
VTGSLSSTYKQYADMYGMDFGTFLSTYLGMDENAFSDAVKKAAETTLKQEILLSAIAEKEQITVSDEDYQKGLSDYASRYGYASTDALLADFDEATVRVSLLMDKTLDFLETANHVEQIVETESESAQTESEAAAGQETTAQTTTSAGQETTAQTTTAAGQETTAQTTAAAGQETTAQAAGGQ